MKHPKFNLILSSFIIGLAVAASFVIVSGGEIGAQNISYPVKELGNCGDENECRDFCNDPDNISACVNFAEKNGLISAEEVAKAKKFIKAGARGPGGCRGQVECEAYCEDVSRINECLSFAERTGLIDEAEIVEARKVAKILNEGGALPGGCKSKAECETYCNDFDHAEECFDFASKSGFIPPEELEDARKAVEVMKSGRRPPGNCRNKAQCEDFCSDPENIEECFEFAEKAGFIPEEELEMARKVIPLMKAGKTPGGCKSKAECEAFCEDEANLDACANFALEAGFMKPEEVEMFRKTGGKGPGGCKGRGGCEDFCNDPANQEVCFNFASEHGLIPPEELEQMKEGFQQFQQGIESAPPEVAECLKSSLGAETFEKLQSGRGLPGPQMGQAMRACFEDFARSQFEQGEGEGFGPPGFEGGEEGGFGPPPGVSPEEFERFKQEGGFPGGEGGGFPSEEEMERFQREGFNQQGFEQGHEPSPEDLERFKEGGFNVEGFESGGPSPEDIKNIIQQRTQEKTQEIIRQKTQEQFERFAPGGDSGVENGGQFFGPGPMDFQGQSPSSGEGGGQFGPPPAGGAQVPPPTSSVLQIILSPLLNIIQ